MVQKSDKNRITQKMPVRESCLSFKEVPMGHGCFMAKVVLLQDFTGF